MPENFNDLLTCVLPESAPQIYHDLARGNGEVSAVACPEHTLSLALFAVATVFGAVIVSLDLFSGPAPSDLVSHAAAFRLELLNFSCFLMSLFVICSIARLLTEAFTTYEFDGRKLTFSSRLAPGTKSEIYYCEIKHVFAGGFLINGLSFRARSNIVIITSDDRRYVLKSISEADILINALISRAAASQLKSPREVALTPQLDRYLTAQGLLPPVLN